MCFKNFGHKYGVNIEFTSNEGASKTSTYLRNLTFIYFQVDNIMKLELIEAGDEKYRIEYSTNEVTLKQLGVKTIMLTDAQADSIIIQLKFIALELERNPKLWFDAPDI